MSVLQKFRRRAARRKKRQKDEIRRIAKRDIVDLFQIAAIEPNRAYAKHYVAEARQISKKTRTPIPRQFRHSFCRICGTPWFGSQRRVRLRSSRKSRRRHIVFSCLVCGNARRIPLSDAR